MCPCVSHACSSAVKQIQGVVGVVVSARAHSSPVVSASARGVTSNHARPAHYLVEAQRRQVGTSQVEAVNPPSLSLGD